MSTPHILTLRDIDNIAVALRRIESGAALAPSGVLAKETVSSGHKIALKRRMYVFSGFATARTYIPSLAGSEGCRLGHRNRRSCI